MATENKQESPQQVLAAVDAALRSDLKNLERLFTRPAEYIDATFMEGHAAHWNEKMKLMITASYTAQLDSIANKEGMDKPPFSERITQLRAALKKANEIVTIINPLQIDQAIPQDKCTTALKVIKDARDLLPEKTEITLAPVTRSRGTPSQPQKPTATATGKHHQRSATAVQPGKEQPKKGGGLLGWWRNRGKTTAGTTEQNVVVPDSKAATLTVPPPLQGNATPQAITGSLGGAPKPRISIQRPAAVNSDSGSSEGGPVGDRRATQAPQKEENPAKAYQTTLALIKGNFYNTLAQIQTVVKKAKFTEANISSLNNSSITWPAELKENFQNIGSKIVRKNQHDTRPVPPDIEEVYRSFETFGGNFYQVTTFLRKTFEALKAKAPDAGTWSIPSETQTMILSTIATVEGIPKDEKVSRIADIASSDEGSDSGPGVPPPLPTREQAQAMAAAARAAHARTQSMPVMPVATNASSGTDALVDRKRSSAVFAPAPVQPTGETPTVMIVVDESAALINSPAAAAAGQPGAPALDPSKSDDFNFGREATRHRSISMRGELGKPSASLSPQENKAPAPANASTEAPKTAAKGSPRGSFFKQMEQSQLHAPTEGSELSSAEGDEAAPDPEAESQSNP